MKITYCPDYKSMSHLAGSLVISEIERNSKLLICTATGNSPAGLYQELVEKSRINPALFGQLRIIKLDEWGGVSENHPVSCEYFLRSRLLEPLNISPENYISFASNPENPEAECLRIRTRFKS